MIGTGGFGQTFITQAIRAPLLAARVAVDVDAETAAKAFANAGIARREIRICRTTAEAARAWADGETIAASDFAAVAELPFDVAVEATGRPEAGARHCRLAIAAGKHVAMVSKEVDSVVGPGLARMAADRGCVVTCVDGDQPSLLINLVSWAEVLGLDIVAAGKASEYDFVFDPPSGRIDSNGCAREVPGLTPYWDLGDRDATDVVSARAAALAAFPQRAVPDLCELGIVANATGVMPDRPDFHAPVARPIEVPTFFAERGDGGLLGGGRRIDVFHCLRRPDEASFAGGVFVVVRCNDRPSWDVLQQKGHVVSRTGATAMLYLPRHILGLEAATSVLDAAIHRVSGYGADYRSRVDLVAVATADLPAGTRLGMGGHHHDIANVTAELRPACPLGSTAPSPFYLAADRRLTRGVSKGEAITQGDIETESGSHLMAVRRFQDAAFFGTAVDG
ncbi:flagellar biosynthesis protein FlgA [Rhodoplanes sp.]|uniref:flagellar biosynthesis protein FlgA n=1 Tax=Rhodoplanes sp. TaxID=1968906 RepID=UPI00345B6087